MAVVILFEEQLFDARMAHGFRHAWALSDHLVRAGFEPVIVTSTSGSLEREMEAPYRHMKVLPLGVTRPLSSSRVMRIIQRVAAIKELFRLAERLAVSGVWFATADYLLVPLGLVVAFRSLSRRQVVPVFLTFHTSGWIDERGIAAGTILEVMARLVFRSRYIHNIFVYTNPLKARLSRLGARRIRVVHHPVMQAVDPPSKTTSRRRLSLPESGVIVGFIGSIHPGKGLDDLVDAIEYLQAHRVNFWLLVAGRVLGEAPGRAANGTARYENVIKARLQDRAIIRFGWVSDREYDLYLSACDVVVLPYRPQYYDARNSTSGILFEAIAHRCLLVVTDVANLGALVREFDLGVVVRPGEPRSLAAGIMTAVRRVRRGKLGRHDDFLNHAMQDWDHVLRTLCLNRAGTI